MSIIHHADARLARAIDKHDLPDVVRCLSSGASLDRFVDGAPPLHRAVIVQSIEIVLHLLIAGASVNAQDDHGATALDVAATFDDVAIVGALISAGASLDSRGDEGYTPLMAAVGRSPQIVALMISSGADVNAQNDASETALDLAITLSDWRSAETLEGVGARRSRRVAPRRSSSVPRG